MKRKVKLNLKRIGDGKPGIVVAVPSDRPEHQGKNISKLIYGSGFVDWIHTDKIKNYYEVIPE